MRIRTPLTAVLAALILGVTAPAAAADWPLVPFPFGDGPHGEFDGAGIRSDGIRFLVWPHGQDAQRIFDEDTRGVREVRTPPNCGLVDAAPNIALFNCRERDSFNPHVLYLRSGAFVPARRREDLPPNHGFVEIGRHWIRGGYTSPTTLKPGDLYLNWRTGELRASYDGVFDLDHPDLPQRSGVILGREGAYTLMTRPRRGGGQALVLIRKGHGHVKLSDCEVEPGCVGASLSAGLVSWFERYDRLQAYDARRRVLFEWHPRGSEFHDTLFVAHTRRRVVTYGETGVVWARIRK